MKTDDKYSKDYANEEKDAYLENNSKVVEQKIRPEDVIVLNVAVYSKFNEEIKQKVLRVMNEFVNEHPEFVVQADFTMQDETMSLIRGEKLLRDIK